MVAVTENYYLIAEESILGGELIIKSTRTRVQAIIGIWRLGTVAEEITKRLPHLTLAQVFNALSYFSDHQDEINEYIRRNRVPDEFVNPLVLNV